MVVIFSARQMFNVPTFEEVHAMLRSLGLKKSEVLVYWTLYRADRPLRTSEIVERTRLSEKTVRIALRNLVDRGYVRRVGRGKGVRYEAVSIRTVMERLKKAIEERVSELFSRLQFPLR